MASRKRRLKPVDALVRARATRSLCAIPPAFLPAFTLLSGTVMSRRYRSLADEKPAFTTSPRSYRVAAPTGPRSSPP